MAQRLVGYTHIGAQPRAAHYPVLIEPEQGSELNQQTSGQPYPLFLALPLHLALEQFDSLLGLPDGWIVEWKWDGHSRPTGQAGRPGLFVVAR